MIKVRTSITERNVMIYISMNMALLDDIFLFQRSIICCLMLCQQIFIYIFDILPEQLKVDAGNKRCLSIFEF